MLKSKMCLVLVFLAPAALADDADALLRKAGKAFQARDYAVAAQHTEAALKAGADKPSAAYNLACCHAQLGNNGEAIS